MIGAEVALSVIMVLIATEFAIIIHQHRDAWDIMMLNTSIVIVTLFMIGLIEENVWSDIVWVLGIVVTGTGIAAVWKVGHT